MATVAQGRPVAFEWDRYPPAAGSGMTEAVQGNGITTGSTVPIEQRIQQLQQQYPTATPENLTQIYKTLRAEGYDVQRPTHAGGTEISQDKLVLPGGQVIDYIGNVGGTPGAWQANPDGYWVNGQPSSTPGTLTPPGSGLPSGYGLGMETGGGPYPLASFSAPGLNAPFTAPFQAPTDISQMPGLQFAMEQAQQAIERSKAARGALNTGGTLKDLAKYETGLALQGYGDAWNRAHQSYLDAYNIFRGNQANAVNNLGGLATTGFNAANAAGNLATGVGNAQAAGSLAQGNTWGNAATNLANLGQDAYLWSHPAALPRTVPQTQPSY